MAMTRRYRKKRSTRSKRSFNRSYRPRTSKGYSRVCRFKATQYAQTIVGSLGGGTVFNGTSFQFAAIPNSSSYTALFDQYRIKKAVLKFVHSYVNQPTSPGSVGNPVLYIVSDKDDGSVPITVGSIIEREKSRILSFSGAQSVHTHTVYPCVSTLELSTSATNIAAGVKYAPWLDSAFNNVAHFGVKYAFDNLAQYEQINLYITYHFECKDTL